VDACAAGLAGTRDRLLLRNGDRLSSVAQPVTVAIKLDLDEETEIARKRIREVVCRR